MLPRCLDRARLTLENRRGEEGTAGTATAAIVATTTTTTRTTTITTTTTESSDLQGQVEANEGAPADRRVARRADEERHPGGEVQAVREVPRQQDAAEDPEVPPVEADGYHERDKEKVKNLPYLVVTLRRVPNRAREEGGDRHESTD